MMEGGIHEGPGQVSQEHQKDRSEPPRKVIAVLLAAIILGVSGIYIWFEYYREWNIRDLENAVILDEDADEFYPVMMGFRHNLAGRTVTVKGEVSYVLEYYTNLGHLTIFGLEGASLIEMMTWGERGLKKGDAIKIDVSFEWGSINGNEGVYSPQVSLPGFGIFARMQVVMHSTSWIFANCAVDATDTGDEVVVRVEKIAEPVPLDIARCYLRQGVNTDAREYMDLMGWYSKRPDVDSILDLSATSGLNGTIEFSDSDNDGYLDDGDLLTLHGLDRPNTDCGAQTYLVVVERDSYPEEIYSGESICVFLSYLIMTSNGTLWADDRAPEGTTTLSYVPGGIALTVDYISRPTSWNEIVFLLHDQWSTTHWNSDADGLSSGEAATYSCGVRDIGTLTAECIVTDFAGNGLLEVGDRVELLARNGTHFDENLSMTLTVLLSPPGMEIAREIFRYGAEPHSNCTAGVHEDSILVTFAPVYDRTEWRYELFDVLWDDVMITAHDGHNYTHWNMTTDALDGGNYISWTSTETTLGDLQLICVATDIQGNGRVNMGDSIEIRTVNREGFLSNGEYSLSICHLPTDSELFSFGFEG